MDGWPALPVDKKVDDMELHEGLLPYLGEYWGWLRCGQGHVCPTSPWGEWGPV